MLIHCKYAEQIVTDMLKGWLQGHTSANAFDCNSAFKLLTLDK